MKLMIIARDNIKKKKGNTLILFLLVSLAVMLLYVGISVLSNVGTVIDRRTEAHNGSDFVLITPSKEPDKIESILREQSCVTELERENGGVDGLSVKYYHENETLDDSQQLEFVFFDHSYEHNISRVDVIDEAAEWKENSIILPYYMKVGMGFSSGDKMYLYYMDQTYEFEIYGFVEDIMFATPSNVPTEKCLIDASMLERLKQDWNTEITLFQCTLDDSITPTDFEETIYTTLKNEISDFKYVGNTILNYDSMKQGASVTANLFVGILTVFSLLLIIISMVIIHFSISNTIEMNIRNIGVLEAIGYTTAQLRIASMMEFLVVSIFGTIAGLIGAIGAGRLIGNILSSSIGLRWNLGFDQKSAVFSIVITLFLVFATVFLSSLKYKRIRPLDALRNGIHVHNFKKNHIRLDHSKLPLDLSIGMKNILYYKRKNIVLCVIVAALAFSLNLSVAIYESFAHSVENMIRLTGVELTDLSITVQDNDSETITQVMNEIKSQLMNQDEVKTVLEVSEDEIYVANNEKRESISFDIYDETDDLAIDTIVEGRRPIHENEIVLTSVLAKEFGVSVGDSVYLEWDENRADYIIVGISQGINHFGKKGMITKAGYQCLNPDSVMRMLYVYLNDQVDIKQEYNAIKDQFADYNVTVANYQDYTTAVLDSVNRIMIAMCEVMVLVVISVIAMILVLMIKTQIIRDQKQYGVNKALGHTNHQLLMQTIMSYLPTVLTGALLGSILAFFGMKQVMILCLSAFGIKKMTMSLSLYYYVLIIAGMAAWTVLITFLCAYRIRKITPSKMVREL